VAQGGSVVLSLADRGTPLGIPTIPGETGVALAGRVTTVMNEDPALDAAGRSAANPSPGRVVSDAVTLSVTVTGTGVNVVPEPGAPSQLVAGAILLGWLARRRAASRRATTADSR
jgi:hypothetical protein